MDNSGLLGRVTYHIQLDAGCIIKQHKVNKKYYESVHLMVEQQFIMDKMQNPTKLYYYTY